jgi:hypothetical protein
MPRNNGRHQNSNARVMIKRGATERWVKQLAKRMGIPYVRPEFRPEPTRLTKWEATS